MAIESLDPEQRRAIKQSSDYDAEAYHLDPWPLIKGEVSSPLTLQRRVDQTFGRQEHRVVANRNIEARSVVAFAAGRLTEQYKAARGATSHKLTSTSAATAGGGGQHNDSDLLLEASYLKRYFEYNSQHSLVLSTREHCTVASYIRDPCATHSDEESNIKFDVVLDRESATFFIVFYALCEIRRGEECMALPFLGQYHSTQQYQLTLLSRISHWYHRWATVLEEQLLKHNVADLPTEVPLSARARPLASHEEARFHPNEAARAATHTLTADEAFGRVDDAQCYKWARCEHRPVAFLSETVSDKCKAQLAALPDYIPATLRIGTRNVLIKREQVELVLSNG